MPLFKKKLDVMGFVNTETHEDLEFNKPYLLLIKKEGGMENELGDDYQEYDAYAMRGRREVFDFLTQRLGSFDTIHSYVMSGAIPLGKEVSVYTFIRLCITKYFAQSSDISIEELNDISLQTSNVDVERFDTEVFYNRELNGSPN
jgi:hypothetical protein